MPTLAESLGHVVAKRAALALTIEGTTHIARQLLRDAQNMRNDLALLDKEIARLTGELAATVENANDKGDTTGFGDRS